jgi:hypothetical protein
MKRKRRSPLQGLWTSVKVESCANGVMKVTPVDPWIGHSVWNERDGGGPGIFTRMRAARHLQRLINSHLKNGRAL